MVKDKVIKLPEKSKEEQQRLKKVEKIGKAANNPEIKQLLNTKHSDENLIKTLQETGRQARITKTVLKG